MDITVQTRSRRELARLHLGEDATLRQLKLAFSNKIKIGVERQRFTSEQTIPLSDDNATLKSLGVGQNSVLIFKDLGPQISYKTVFLVEYAGPLFIYFFFFLRPSFIYSSEAATTAVQSVAFVAWTFHFAKREFETLFVHRFSNDTMPIFNLWKNCAYYWAFAVVNGYLINRPHFGENSSFLSILLPVVLFAIFELGNGVVHLQLRNLRPSGTKKRGVPRGGLFNYVSCPNYTCEIAAWAAFSLLTGSLGSWLFTLVGAGQMFLWAKNKHSKYRKEFRDYPAERKILIPFII